MKDIKDIKDLKDLVNRIKLSVLIHDILFLVDSIDDYLKKVAPESHFVLLINLPKEWDNKGYDAFYSSNLSMENTLHMIEEHAKKLRENLPEIKARSESMSEQNAPSTDTPQ